MCTDSTVSILLLINTHLCFKEFVLDDSPVKDKKPGEKRKMGPKQLFKPDTSRLAQIS